MASTSDVDDGWQLEVGATVTFLCAFIAVSFRTFARYRHAQLGWDDWTMAFALLLALVATIFDFVAVSWGLGRHSIFLSNQELINQQYWSLLAQVFCINALTFAKISICLAYLRVIRGAHRTAMKWTLYVTAFLVFAVNSVSIISFYAECNPPAKSWNPFLPGTCWKPITELSLGLFQGAFSALTDFFLAGFPFFLFKKLQIKKKSKHVLLVLMGLGTVTGVFALVRTIQASAALYTPPNAVSDTSFTTILGLLWAGMERNIAIMIASVPAIRPLAAPFFQQASRTFTSGRKSTGQPGSYKMERPNNFRKINDETYGSNVPISKSRYPYDVTNETTARAHIPTVSEERILPHGNHEQV